jgi:histone deacetylase 1/2
MLTGPPSHTPSSVDHTHWFPDSGATHHVTHDGSLLSDSSFLPGGEQILMGNGQGLAIHSVGSGTLISPYKPHTSLALNDLLLVPTITKNLVSVSKFARDNKVFFEFHSTHCFVKSQATSEILLKGTVGIDGLYSFDGLHASSTRNSTDQPAATGSIPPISVLSTTCNSLSPSTYDLWHYRLGHPHHEVLNKTLSLCNVAIPNKTKFTFCSSCCMGKAHRLPSSPSITVYTEPLALVFADLWGPASVESHSGFHYFLTCVDAYSRYTWIFPLKRKSDTTSTFIQFQSMAELQLSCKLKAVQTDGGGEFKPLTPHFNKLGILHRLSCPHTHHQQGSVERKHRHVVDTGLSLLAQAHMPMEFWDHAFLTAAYLINRLPTSVLNHDSPYFKLYKVQPDYKFLRIFGSACFPLLRPYNSSKLSFRSSECVFIGYSSTHKGYKCLDPSGRVYISKDVLFNEFRYPYSELFSSSPAGSSSSPSISSAIPLIVPPLAAEQQVVPETSSSNATSSSSDSAPESPSIHEPVENVAQVPSPPSSEEQPSPSQSSSSDSSAADQLPPISVNQHPMQTRAKSGIVMPRLMPTLLVTQAVPTQVRQALKDPKWQSAMQAEFDALQANNTWSLVPLPSHRKPIGCKWIFRVKENPDGTVNRYKARLVAKGYHQVHGFDYQETFCPVVKPVTIRLILTMAVTHKWPIQQLDVNNAFLNGALEEEVYMIQPPGFESQDKSLVCRLTKALYGLKQAPRAWFDRLKTALMKYGFKASCCDPSLFTLHTSTSCIYILVYVDDIIITGSSLNLIHTLTANLNSEFSLKQLGNLDYFLGVQVTHLQNGSLILSQAKYVTDLLERAGMTEAKGISTPMISGQRLSKHGANYYQDPTFYRSIVGALQYATLTRPEISFAVNKVCQFLSQPLEEHWKATKRILRYLKGTLHHGLLLRPASPTTPTPLLAFCDADWGADPDDRRSTSGSCLFFGPNLISWSSKKQTLVARSSTEAEYRSLANTAADILWVQSLLQELHIPFLPPRILCDNMSTVALTHNPVLHTRTKHMELDIFFVREKVLAKTLLVSHVPSIDQTADIFTKALSPTRFELLRDKLNVICHVG